MPNIGSLLKLEIARVARKELKTETAALKTASSKYRAEIAELKRRVAEVERTIKRIGKNSSSRKALPAADQHPSVRFSAKGFGSLRKRLGLSAAETGLLINASAQSVYNWEEGKSRPRQDHILAIAKIRRFGKKDAAQRLAEVNAA